jgi:hypothetical protein
MALSPAKQQCCFWTIYCGAIPNLRDTYGRQYRVTRDDCAESWHDPWLHIIPGRNGSVYVHSEDHAGVEVERRRKKAIGHLRDRGYPVYLDAEDVMTFLVPWKELRDVLPWLRPRKRRHVHMTDEQKRQAAERLLAGRLSKQSIDTEHPTEAKSSCD